MPHWVQSWSIRLLLDALNGEDCMERETRYSPQINTIHFDCPRTHAFDGDKSPPESGENSQMEQQPSCTVQRVLHTK
jgi:hypothetical protein